MAKSASPASDKAAAGASSSSLKKTIAELLLVTLIAIAAGGLLATLNPPTAKPAETAAAGGKTSGPAAGGKKEPECAAASNLMDLPPIVTNLATPGDTWIRVEAAIVFDAKAMPHPEVVAAEIATDELAYLRTLSLTELQGPIGLENLRQDLGDRAAIRSGGKVSEFILKTLVVQ